MSRTVALRSAVSPTWHAEVDVVVLSQAMVEQECVGAIVCKLDMHKKMFRRGYIAMLAVDSKHRRKSIGESLKCSKSLVLSCGRCQVTAFFFF